MGKRAAVSVDWLRKGRMVEDLTILRNLIADYSAGKVETATLDETLFEKTFNLRPLPSETSSKDTISRAMGLAAVNDSDEIHIEDLEPIGTTLQEQIESLLPTNLKPEEKNILSYIFARFVIQDTPKDTAWPLVPEGLDRLSAALFTVNFVSRFIGSENPWLLPLWLYKVEENQMQSLQKTCNVLESGGEIDDISSKVSTISEEVKKLASKDPLAETISKWAQALNAVAKKPKRDVNNTLQRIVGEVFEEINSRKDPIIQRIPLTQWNIHALRPDGPYATEHESMLNMFRGNINILNYEPLARVCEILSESERAGRPSASEIEQVVETKRRMSHYTLQRLGLVLTERYILSVNKLGLRYRFIFTEKQKPIIRSAGLQGRMILSESSHEGCTVHLEPESCKGPLEETPPNTIQMTVDSELVSMRMDLYDSESRTWKLEPWKSASRRPGRTPSWLMRETEYRKGTPHTLTRRQIDLIGPVLAFRGLRVSRMWMLENMGFIPRTARRYLRGMLEKKIVRLLYTPSLEYCGLPEGMLVVGGFKENRLRESFIDWMTSRIPFVRVFTDRSTNLVAYLRVPHYKTDVVGGVIREKLLGRSKKDRMTTQLITARLRSYKTYYMTALQRLIDDNEFIDPWTK